MSPAWPPFSSKPTPTLYPPPLRGHDFLSQPNPFNTKFIIKIFSNKIHKISKILSKTHKSRNKVIKSHKTIFSQIFLNFHKNHFLSSFNTFWDLKKKVKKSCFSDLESKYLSASCWTGSRSNSCPHLELMKTVAEVRLACPVSAL